MASISPMPHRIVALETLHGDAQLTKQKNGRRPIMLDKDQLYLVKIYVIAPGKMDEFNVIFQRVRSRLINEGIPVRDETTGQVTQMPVTMMDVLTDQLRGDFSVILIIPVRSEPANLFDPWDPDFN